MTLTTWKYLMDAKLPYKCMQYPRASHRSLIEANVKKKKTMATLGMQCDIYGMCEAKAFIYVRTCVKSSVCVCTYACVWLQGTIYVLCIYAFPMNITLWQNNSYIIYEMCLLLKKKIDKMTMSKTGERKWNELYQMRLYWLIIHHHIKDTSHRKIQGL